MYKARHQRLELYNIFFIVLLWNILSSHYGNSILLFLIVLLLTAGLALIRFELEIRNDHIVYQIGFYKKSIINKKIEPAQIKQLKFTRVGWAKKAAIIKLHKGINIRLAGFDPEEVYDQLIQFGEQQDLTILKTKDYAVLERMR
ncbi:hypothetical protein [Halobacillus sp. Marseille-P3879]|uniref:hypothetical protein n=1 Tax=Halobacillus sp. Marseille-P3879 TaxID=2045014 RepID=UPI000C7C1200|nr:hypothetical protein [Halobacillus sp. Marseille-P3879]